MDERHDTWGELARRLLRSASVRVRLFLSPGDYQEAIRQAEGLKALRNRAERQHKEIERLRELLNRQAPGVVVTGKDGTLHQFDEATGWEREKDGALRVIRKLEDSSVKAEDVAAFAPGTWRDVRHP